MGYAAHRFVGAVDQNLICGVCSAVLADAVLTPCGHSFCQGCLDRWLDQHSRSSCPECRGRVCVNEARPILSVRNLIRGLSLRCEHVSRGCSAVMTVERLKGHLETCAYTPVRCVACDKEVNRCELPGHQIQCEAIAAAVHDEDDGLQKLSPLTRSSPPRLQPGVNEMTELACKVASLELQVKRMKRDLEFANAKNKRLEKEMQKTRSELQEKRGLLQEHESVHELDPDYEYGHTPHSIARLSCLIARFLLKKPEYVDRGRIFSCVKRCYEQYARCGNSYEHDVHMLVATAYASNWFTDDQKLSIHCWLQSIARYRRFSHELLRYRHDPPVITSSYQTTSSSSSSIVSN